MTRIFVLAGFVFASTSVGIAASQLAPSDGLEVCPTEAATVLGGQCGSYQKVVDGACTNASSDSCSNQSSNCNGQCPYTCSSTVTYSGTGTFTGLLQSPSQCSLVTQGTCTSTICSVTGALLPCCECVGGTNVSCGPNPVDLDTEGCSAN